MKKALIIVGVFGIGILAGGGGVYYSLSELMLWGTYVGAASDANVYISILNEVKANNSDQAIKYLENYLGNSEGILKGCIYDLCKNNSIQEVDAALEAINEYKSKMFNNQQ